MGASPPDEERKMVLFACTLNCIRSPMAAAMLHQLAGSRIVVKSAGVRTGLLDPYAVAVMDEIGIDMSEHEPQSLRIVDDELFDVIVSLSPEAHHHVLELTRTSAVEVEYWPTFDCSLALSSPKRDKIIEAYRGVRDELFRRIRQRFKPEGGVTL